jgi:hypothetical protein
VSGPKLPASSAHGWKKQADAVAPTEGEAKAKRRKSVFAAVEDILSAIPDGEQVEVRKLLAEVIVRKAMRGNVKMIEAILSRSDPVATPSSPSGPVVNIEFGKLVMGIDAEAMRNGQAPRDVNIEPPAELPQADLPPQDEANHSGIPNSSSAEISLAPEVAPE